jgi:type II secretory ATPase GspE/PulE/Tfp pilus assembly ATPase PilB-like protein
MAEDASVVKLVNQLFQEAINDRATDIHFEVQREDVVVRRRIDGILYDTYLPKNIRLLYPAMVSRIKLMSGLDIVERRLPQDGRCRVNIGRKEYDLRISIVPAIHGEDIVVRILPTSMLFDLNELGLSADHRDALEKLIARPHGIIFVTGPTGSGKSTTLYACLSKLNIRDRKIITIEDPVEYELKGITQTQVNHKIGLTFARLLRSMLRHDPDVMMVGEVRDRETAEIAVQTAMTGHLVLSTLHTNDAAGGAVRLIDMGIDPYLIASTVLAFTAQRLVRVICTDCKESYESEGRQMYRGRGCASCRNSGYHGRVAISEIMPLEPEIQALILSKSSAKLIRDKADVLGMRTLYHDGWDKVAQGVTTAEEVLRVTSL